MAFSMTQIFNLVALLFVALPQAQAKSPGHEIDGSRPVQTKIVISPETIPIQIAESGRTSAEYVTSIEFGSRKDSLRARDGWGEAVTGEISFIIVRGSTMIETYLPSDMTRRLGVWLRNGSPVAECDCGCFAHAVNGIPGEHGFDEMRWYVRPYRGNAELVAGETVVTTREHHTQLSHAAIYIGSGLFLQRPGPVTGLSVMTYDQIVAAWGGDETFVFSPREEYQTQ